mgnify:CR=1 FL=1
MKTRKNMERCDNDQIKQTTTTTTKKFDCIPFAFGLIDYLEYLYVNEYICVCVCDNWNYHH